MGETGRSNMPSDCAMASVSIRTSTSSQTFPDLCATAFNLLMCFSWSPSPSLALATKEEQLQWEAASGCWYWMQWIWWTVCTKYVLHDVQILSKTEHVLHCRISCCAVASLYHLYPIARMNWWIFSSSTFDFQRVPASRTKLFREIASMVQHLWAQPLCGKWWSLGKHGIGQA